jgi:putative sterol carrier protein
MLSIDIPPDSTVESLLTEVVPALHARLVGPHGSSDLYIVNVRLEGHGSWTVRIRGGDLAVTEGEAERPTLWMHASERAVERFLEDALGPRRLLPRFVPLEGVTTPSDPRLLRRVAMASGRIELAMVDQDGERVTLTFGFGAAARKGIDPEDADVVVEAHIETIERVLHGQLAPEAALADGEVTVRGNRFLAMQLALAVAPFYPAKT